MLKFVKRLITGSQKWTSARSEKYLLKTTIGL